MNDTRREPTDELGRSRRLLRQMNDERDLLRDLRWRFWTGFAISFVACWVGFELGRRERCS